MHTLATIICYEVLDDIPCPSANMKCCVESSSANATTSTVSSANPTTTKPMTTYLKTTTTQKPATKPTQKLEKQPSKSDSNKIDGEIFFFLF